MPREWVFSYGTLRLPEVQLGTYGRLLDGVSDLLPGWRLEQLAISNPDVVALSGVEEHPVAVPTGDPLDTITGERFTLTPDELAATDGYESADYVRTSVVLSSGVTAWLYVGRP